MIIAILVPSFIKLGILIDFKIKQDFIIEELCINIEKPMTMCHGKCYLTAQLLKTENPDNKQHLKNVRERFEVVYYFFKNVLDFMCLKFRFLSELDQVFFNPFHTSSYLSTIFRPPKFG